MLEFMWAGTSGLGMILEYIIEELKGKLLFIRLYLPNSHSPLREGSLLETSPVELLIRWLYQQASWMKLKMTE